MSWYKMAISQMFSEWLAKEISNLTGNYSRPYSGSNNLPNVDYEKIEKWVKETRPDLNNMSLYDVINQIRRSEIKKEKRVSPKEEVVMAKNNSKTKTKITIDSKNK